MSDTIDTRKQNIKVEIPGCVTLSMTEKQKLVLNNIVLVDISVVEDAMGADKSPGTLCYVTTIHSSQVLTMTDTIVWIVDYLIELSNLFYLAVYRVRQINQLRGIAVGNADIYCDDDASIVDDIIDVEIINTKTLVTNSKTKKK